MKQKINLYVDDLRDCPTGFVVARTVLEAVDLIKKNNVHILSLDNDMGLNSDGSLALAGKDFVNLFCQNKWYADQIYIHTDNPVERSNMLRSLEAAQRRGFISNQIEIFGYPYIANRYSR